MLKIEKLKLENGLNCLLIDTKSFPTVTCLLLVSAGSRHENYKNNGIAHFLEHMAFKGSKKYPTTMILSSLIEGFGGVINAFTGKDHTGYWIKAPVKHLETCIDVLSDMIQNPLLDKVEISREKGVITEEINMYEDQPEAKVEDVFSELVFPKNALGLPTAGKKEIINSFTEETFRKYRSELYMPKNSVLIIAGGISEKKNIKKMIEGRFNSWKNGEISKYSDFLESQKDLQIKIFSKKTEQAHIVLGFRAFSFFEKKRYALNLLATILGGGMSSRLFYEVRERRGLCYYINTYNEMYADTGLINTRIGVGTDLTKLKSTLKLVLTEHQKIVENGVNEEEFKRAKELVKGHFLLALEDSRSIASFLGTDYLLKKTLRTPEEIIKSIDSVKLSEIQILAKELFKLEKLNIAVVGPFKENSLQKALFLE